MKAIHARKVVHITGSILCSLALLLALLCSSILFVAGNAGYMNTLFLRHADPGITGVDTKEYPALAEKITSYLVGKADTFQTTLSIRGQAREAFSEKELTHMQDVKNLFSLCRTVLYTCLTWILLWLGLSFSNKKGLLVSTARCYLWTSLVIALLGITLAIWAVVDFHTLFTGFHHVFFTNNLWQLDPNQDLLLQLMPTGFFIEYAARIGLCWLCGTALLVLISIFYLKRRKRNA